MAVKQFALIDSGNVGPATDYTYEEKLANAISKLFPNSDTTLLDTVLSTGIKELYKVSNEQGYVVVVEDSGVTAAVAVSNDKTVGNVEILEGEATDLILSEIKVLASNQFN